MGDDLLGDSRAGMGGEKGEEVSRRELEGRGGMGSVYDKLVDVVVGFGNSAEMVVACRG